jgi:hypothetical protein
VLIFHSNGDNVLGYDQVSRVFDALEATRNTEGYNELCAGGDYTDPAAGEVACKIDSVAKFWGHSKDAFLASVSNDQETTEAISSRTFPDGSRVADKDLFGKPVRDENGILISATMYLLFVETPDIEDVDEFELSRSLRTVPLKTNSVEPLKLPCRCPPRLHHVNLHCHHLLQE